MLARLSVLARRWQGLELIVCVCWIHMDIIIVIMQAQACLERTKDYIKERKQFGKTIADNQYIQFKFAEMATALVSAR